MDHYPTIASFSRRKSRGFTPKQKQLWEAMTKRSIIIPTADQSSGQWNSSSDAAMIKSLGGDNSSLRIEGEWLINLMKADERVLEIGFGSGEHIVQLLTKHSDVFCIGCEPFRNGVVNLLSQVRARDDLLTRIAIWPDDGLRILAHLPDYCLDSIYILFPDPWPKTKQHKRRIVNNNALNLLRTKLRDSQAKVVIATDHIGYSQWILRLLGGLVEQKDQFAITDRNSIICSWTSRDWRIAYSKLESEAVCLSYGIHTRYAAKALAAKQAIHHFVLQLH